MKIGDRVSYGVKWVSVSLVATRVARLFTSIVLARLLAPEFFGVVSMANVAITTIGIIREIGFGAAFIQKSFESKNHERIAANSMFFISFLLNSALFGLCSFLSPVVASFFRSQQLEIVFEVLIVSFLLNIFQVVPTMILQKNMEFGKLSVSEIVQGISLGLIGIILAVMNFGIWSLVIAQIISQLLYCIMVMRLSNWRPRIEFDFGIAKEMYSYGKFIWAFTALSVLGGALDRIIIGRFWGAANVGYYGMAFQLCHLPTSYISSLINQVTFPVFSKIKADKLRLKKALITTLSNVALVTMPMCFGLVAIADNFILTVYGSKWEPAIPPVKVLAFFGLTLSLSSVTGPVFKAIGKPNILLYTSVLHHTLMIILLYIFRGLGVVGICYAVLIPLVISSIIAFGLIVRYLQFSILEVLRPIIKSASSAIAMFVVVKYFKLYLLNENLFIPGVFLFVLVVIGILGYLLSSLLLNRSQLMDFRFAIYNVIVSKGSS